MELTFDFFEQLEDLYLVKSWHLRFLNSMLPEAWQASIPDGYGKAWEKRDWKFFLKDMRPFPKPLQLLVPEKRGLLTWTMIGFSNELIMEVSPESLGDFLDRYVDNPTARRNLWELFLGEEMSGVGMKAFGSLVVCAREENRFIDRYLPMLRTFAIDDPRKAGVDDELRNTALDFFKEIDDFRRYMDSDVFLFKKLNRDLKELFRKGVSVGVLGYGDVSSVLALGGESSQRTAIGSNLAYKKMPPFPDRESVESYSDLFDRYHLLLKEIGLNPPRHGIRQVSKEDGAFTVFATQTRLPAESFASSIIREADAGDCRTLFAMIAREAMKVAAYNLEHPDLIVGIDIQISNWAVEGYDPREKRVTGEERLFYIDTSTPMIREHGNELLDRELFMRSIPPFLRGIVRAMYLEDLLDHFYDTRAIVIELLSNFIKEGRPELVPPLVEDANALLAEGPPGSDFEPVSIREVEREYRRERRLARTLQASRRLDRFFQEKVLRRRYPYRLPEKSGYPAAHH